MPHVQLPEGIPGIRALFALHPDAAAPLVGSGGPRAMQLAVRLTF